MAVLVAILIALLVAGAVLLVASVASNRRGGDVAGPLRAFRNGWTGRKNPDEEQRAAAVAASAPPVDVSLDEFLRATTDEGDAYLNVDELSATLQRARDKAARALPRTHRD